MPLVRIKSVSKAFELKRGNSVQVIPALNNVSFDVEQGEIVALAGPSGCGKTTALRAIMGLETVTSGSISVGNKVVTGCGHDRGMVFQHAELLPWKTAAENIKFALEAKGIDKSKRDEITRHYLEMVGLSHARDRHPHQLSGGMRQRVGIARALAIDPDVLLMDEPFAALDSQTRETLQLEVLSIHERTRKTIIFVTHDLDEAVLLADRVVVMSAGEVHEIIPINIPRPRRDMRDILLTPEFTLKRHKIWTALHDSGSVAGLAGFREANHGNQRRA
jgi:NitT/TauT family transport system ATP-binding protein